MYLICGGGKLKWAARARRHISLVLLDAGVTWTPCVMHLLACWHVELLQPFYFQSQPLILLQASIMSVVKLFPAAVYMQLSMLVKIESLLSYIFAPSVTSVCFRQVALSRCRNIDVCIVVSTMLC